MSVFKSAITGDDGTVDPGYLAVYWTMAVTVGIIPFIVLIAGIAVFKYPGAAETIQSTGIAVGAICTGCAAVIAGVGMFRAGDTKHAPPLQTTTTTTTATTAATAGTADDPLKVALVPNKKAVKKRGR